MLFTDGASRGNPGAAAIGVVLRTPDGRTVEEIGEAIGVATNNAAEYAALIRGLRRARELGARRVVVHADSELLVRQLEGTYAVRHEGLRPLFEEARRLLACFEAAEVRHVPREENRDADRLAHAALDRRDRGASSGRARRLRVLQIDAFTREPLSGNPAGLVPDAAGLDDGEMQRIAREMNVSETAFLLPPQGGGDYRLRYFTPTREVDLCGHATVAAFHFLAVEGRLAPAAPGAATRALLETRAGLLPVEVRWEDGRPAVMMGQPAPRFRACAAPVEELAACLGLPADEVGAPGLTPALASTGLWHLLVPVRSLEAVRRAAPDQARLGRLNEALGVHTTHVYALAALDPGADAHARCFAPALGVAEDPLTGTANGALGAFLAAAGLLGAARGLGRPAPARPGAVSLVVEQGHELGRPGLVRVEVVPGRPPVSPVAEVWVGGEAVIALDGYLFLPA